MTKGDAQYVRDHYHVPAKRGMRVMVNGSSGVITGFGGAYLLVRFDDGISAYCHPTWRVKYLAANDGA